MVPSIPDATGLDVLSTTEKSLQIDNCFRLLSDRRRRFCLYYLLQADAPVPIEELAVLVEASVTPPDEEVPERAIEDTRMALIHGHLPKLQNEGIVRVADGAVRLEADPGLPVVEWLAATARVELRP